MDDDELTRLAEEELIREAKRGEAREAVHGVMGWLRDKTPRTNKRFLSTTISNALQHNHRQRNVGSHKIDDDQVPQDKLKIKEWTDPNSSVKQTVDKSVKSVDGNKTKQFHKPNSSKLPQKKCHGEVFLTDVRRSGHSPKRKKLKLLE